MKTMFFYFISFLCFPLTGFCTDFNPTVLTIKGQPVISYNFGGNDCLIPFTIEGTSAAVWFVINTKDQAQNIRNVRNGYLGWHYVNKIDTTIYISERYDKEPGETQIIWDGKDENGNFVEAGEYNYYLWGYDYKSPRQLACQNVKVGLDWESQFTYMIEKGEDGLPLAKPMLFGSPVWWYCSDAKSWLQHGTVFKWILGNDPEDNTLLQTTLMSIYDVDETNYDGIFHLQFSYGGPVLNPQDYNIFYNCSVNFNRDTDTLKLDTFNKWEFIPGGDAILDENWLGWDNLSLEDKGVGLGLWSQKPSCYTDGNYIYAVSPGLHNYKEEWNKLRCVSFDGMLVFDKMLHEWYMPNEKNPNNFINGAFNKMCSRTPNQFFLLNSASCMHEMINTSRLIDDSSDETDMIMFQNSNGDYFMDSKYFSDLEASWFCLNESPSQGREGISIDANGFNIINVSYLGLTSFGVSTQDGTGIGYMQFADDTYSKSNTPKGGGILCDSGSAYDGLYISGALRSEGNWTDPRVTNTNYVAFDSFHGIIKSGESTPFILLTSPNGGEILAPGEDFNITWDSGSAVQKVKLEYSTDSGSTWITIDSGINNTGSYTWIVPDVRSYNCLIRINDISNSGSSDISNSIFSIIKTLTLLFPNGGEKLSAGAVKDIKWTSGGIENVKIEYSTDNGSSWFTVVEKTESDGTYSWIMPDIISSNCLIRISNADKETLFDTSDFVFSLISKSVKVLYPNGNEELLIHGKYIITWTSSNVTYVNIEFSSDNGLNWKTIASLVKASSGTYLWEITDLPSTKCIIKVRDSSLKDISDTNDNLFSIAYFSSFTKSENKLNFSLSQNSPNPFNPKTTIEYFIPKEEYVRLIVYNSSGQQVAILADGILNSGNYAAVWNALDMPSGLYFYKISAGLNSETKKMLLLK